MGNELIECELIEGLNRCRKALEKVESLEEKNQKSKPHVMELLFARDAILKFQKSLSLEDITRFFENENELLLLDEKIRLLGPFIASTLDMKKWQLKLKPLKEEAWWWFLQPPMDPWQRFDWLFNAITIGVLALSASFMVNIYKAVSAGNASVVVTFSTIAQAAGLAIIGGGALSDRGKRKVAKILRSLNISERFFAEVTFITSFVLLGVVYGTNCFLDGYFLEEGKSQYDKGALNHASLSYRKGMIIAPDNTDFSGKLGEVYESLGSLNLAAQNYQKSVEDEKVERLNDLGRVNISMLQPGMGKPDPVRAQAILMLGLQRAEIKKNPDEELLYEINRNLGWALLNQGKLEHAEDYLEDAIEWDVKVNKARPGGGMAYCFMAEVYEKSEKADQASKYWLDCIKCARPEFISEYKWFLDMGRDRVAYCVDSSHIVSGFEKKNRRAEVEEWCKRLRKDLQDGGKEYRRKREEKYKAIVETNESDQTCDCTAEAEPAKETSGG